MNKHKEIEAGRWEVQGQHKLYSQTLTQEKKVYCKAVQDYIWQQPQASCLLHPSIHQWYV